MISLALILRPYLGPNHARGHTAALALMILTDNVPIHVGHTGYIAITWGVEVFVRTQMLCVLITKLSG